MQNTNLANTLNVHLTNVLAIVKKIPGPVLHVAYLIKSSDETNPSTTGHVARQMKGNSQYCPNKLSVIFIVSVRNICTVLIFTLAPDRCVM